MFSLDDALDPVAVANKDGAITYLNPAFRTWLGNIELKASIPETIQDFNWSKALERIQKYGVYLHEETVQIDGKKRKTPIAFEFKPYEGEQVYVRILDYSKVKEKDLLLASHSKMIEKNNREIKRKSKQIQELLDNMKQAVFTVGSSLEVKAPVSKFASELFGEEFIRSSVFDSVFRSMNEGDENYDRLKSAFVAVIGEDELQWEMVEDEFPSRVSNENQDGTSQELRITYTPILGSEDTVDRVMLVVEDVTKEEELKRNLQSEREKSHQNIELLQEIAKLDKMTLESFLKKTSKTLSNSLANIRKIEEPSSELINDLFREIHTLKGNSRAFGLSHMSGVLHKAESQLSSLRNGHASEPLTSLRNSAELHVKNAQTTLKEYAKLAEKIFGIKDEFKRLEVEQVYKLALELDRSIDPFDVALGYSEASADASTLQRAAHTLKAASRAAHTLKAATRNASEEGDQNTNQEVSALVHKIEKHLTALFNPSIRDDFNFAQFSLDYSDFVGQIQSTLMPNIVGPIQREDLDSLVKSFGNVISVFTEGDSSSPEESTRAVHLFSLSARDCNLSLTYEIAKEWERLDSYQERLERFQAVSPSIQKYLDLCVWMLSRGHDRAQFRSPNSQFNVANDLEFPQFSKPELDACVSVARKHLPSNDLSVEYDALADSGNGLARTFCKIVLEFRKIPRNCAYSELALIFDLASLSQTHGSGVSSDGILALPQTLPVIEKNYRRLCTHFESIEEGSKYQQLLEEMPVGATFSKLRGIALDASRALGKKVDLELRGSTVLFNREKLALLYDAFVHAVRNSVDHGIEPSEERTRLNKPEISVLVLGARLENGELTLELVDDGRGVNVDAVATKAVSQGLVQNDAAQRMSDQEKRQLIFHAGLSTTNKVTEMSGRGVGMDVIRSTAEKLGGTAEVLENKPGTRIVVIVPQVNPKVLKVA